MNISEYQTLASRTMLDGDVDHVIDEHGLVIILRLLELMQCGGSILDQLKKDVLHGHKQEHDRKGFRRELAKLSHALDRLSQANNLESKVKHTEYKLVTQKGKPMQLLMLSLVWNLTGLMGESAEVGELVYEATTDGLHPYGMRSKHNQEMRDNMKKELGDVMWYLSALATNFEIDLSAIAEFNIERLKARYPDGFSQEASMHRS